MDLLLPLCAFIFVLAGFGAVDNIRRGEDWGTQGFFCALGFAGMVWLWVMMTAR